MHPPEDCPLDNETDLEFTWLPAGLVFLSQFVLGVGTTLYFSLGQTYLDDNTKKTNTPMLLGRPSHRRACRCIALHLCHGIVLAGRARS